MCEDDRELDGDVDVCEAEERLLATFHRVHFATEQIIMGVRFDAGWYDIRRSVVQDDGEVGF